MYEINGTPLLLQPEEGGWQERNRVGVDGQNRPVYEPTYQYRLRCGPMTMMQFHQLCEFFEEVSVTGTASIVLPCHCASDCGVSWTGTIFTNVLLEEPRMGSYWQEHAMGVTLMVRNIRVT